MADIIKSIVTRIDTTANWTTLNPIPANGEQCIEILGKGLFKLKVGDGVTPWIALQYETLGQGFSQYKILLEKEIRERIAGDQAIQNALENEIARSTEKDIELDETVGRLSELIEGIGDNKLDKVDTPSIVYGTDALGQQTTFSVESFGMVDDVQLNGTSVVVDKVANIEPGAVDITYTNSQYPEMQNLQDAMDHLLYVTPSVSLSGGGTYEDGYTKATTQLTWTWNKTIVSQSLNQGIGALPSNFRSYLYETPITSDTTFTITGSDGKNSKSSSTSVTFQPKRYWGVSTKTSLEDADILALSSELSTNRKQTRTFNCSGGKYFYFVIRTSYCSGIAFKVGGLSFSDMICTTRDVVNAQGKSASYNIYRVNNIQTGSAISVEVL